jgi:putative Ca2+/H+ antiporter (TMEM165/GDT1 family)
LARPLIVALLLPEIGRSVAVIGYQRPISIKIMEAFLVSALAVTVGEIGDKTQLLALLLAARYKKPIPIILGILIATLANHALAGLLGQWVATNIPSTLLRWSLGLSFLAIAAWTLKPDEMEDEGLSEGKYGVFVLTCITFFIAEIGDKTQLATVALAAKYSNLYLVIAGTTLGMLIADIPAVFLGKIAAPNFPFKIVRWIAAGVFAILGVLVLIGIGDRFL